DNIAETTYRTSYRQSFQIAPQSEKQYHFSVFCPEEFWQTSVPLRIDYGRGSPFTPSITLDDLDQQNKQLIVVVSDQPGAYKYLGPERRNIEDFTLDKQPVSREVASVTPAELPTRWHDLAIANLLIIDGPPLGGLSDEQ